MSEEFGFSCEHAAHRKSSPSEVSHYEQLEARHRSSPASLKTLAHNELLQLYSLKCRGLNIFILYCFFNIHSCFKFKPDLPLAGHHTSGDTFDNAVTSILSQKMHVVVDTLFSESIAVDICGALKGRGWRAWQTITGRW